MAIGAVSSVTDKPGLQEVEDLFREHHELVYRTAYSILNNAADSEDVVQSLFLRLVRRRALAIAVGLAFVAPAIWVEFFSRYEAWWIDGLALVLGATGAALCWTGLTGAAPDWVE